MDPALGSGKRELECARDFLVRPAFNVAQHQRRPVLERKLSELGGEERRELPAFSESVMPALSVNVVAFAWAAISIVLLGAAAYAGIVRPMKQIRKNDDIV